MILGVDLGNYYTKSSKGISFISKVSSIEGMGDNKLVKIGNTSMYLGEGEFDAEYRKAYKPNLLYLLQGALLESSTDKDNKVVVGLPLSQYMTDKCALSNRIMQSGLVQDVEIACEGINTVPNEFEGIIIDIGGRTTDICQLILEGGRRKVKKPYSLPRGMLNLESDFVNSINSKHGLDLVPGDAGRILINGLYIYGERVEYSMDVYKEFVEGIVGRIQVDYSLKTNNVALVGGGSKTLYNPIKKRIPQAQLIDNSFFANAMAYEIIGRNLWNE